MPALDHLPSLMTALLNGARIHGELVRCNMRTFAVLDTRLRVQILSPRGASAGFANLMA